MEEVMNSFGSGILDAYNSLMAQLPPFFGSFVNLFLLVFVVVIFSIFIWKFYRFIASKNIIELNLSKYNKSEHPFFVKLLAGFFYFIEYLIILPFLVFVWFNIFTLFLIVLSEDSMAIAHILVISTIIIAAIRMTAYYSEDLSKDLAKMLPFTLLVFFILSYTSFSFERVINRISRIPGFLENILIYLGFIIVLEIILRFFDFVFSLFGLEEVEVGVET